MTEGFRVQGCPAPSPLQWYITAVHYSEQRKHKIIAYCTKNAVNIPIVQPLCSSDSVKLQSFSKMGQFICEIFICLRLPQFALISKTMSDCTSASAGPGSRSEAKQEAPERSRTAHWPTGPLVFGPVHQTSQPPFMFFCLAPNYQQSGKNTKKWILCTVTQSRKSVFGQMRRWRGRLTSLDGTCSRILHHQSTVWRHTAHVMVLLSFYTVNVVTQGDKNSNDQRSHMECLPRKSVNNSSFIF